MARHLIVMLKEPRAGRVKTRLGRDIGMVEAAWWFRHQTARLLRRLEDPRWTLTLAIAPRRAVTGSHGWPAHLRRVPQGDGDLGARMARLLRTAPPGPAMIVGADIPGLRAAHVARAFRLLDRSDAVFGPAADGGFWLVGLRRVKAPPPALFRGVRWSSEHALGDSIATLPGRRIAIADLLHDVDTAADLSA